MAPFYRWLLAFSLICLAFAVCFFFGVVDEINRGDFTKISFGIMSVFSVLSVYVGKLTYTTSKARLMTDQQLVDIKNNSEIGWFFSALFLVVGMIGTVLGFIFMLKMNLVDVNPSSVLSLKDAIGTMVGGMSAALYTTASGLICSALLQLQLFNLKMVINRQEKNVCR